MRQPRGARVCQLVPIYTIEWPWYFAGDQGDQSNSALPRLYHPTPTLFFKKYVVTTVKLLCSQDIRGEGK